MSQTTTPAGGTMTAVGELADLPPGGRISAVIDDRAILVVRVGDEVYAVEDLCSHDGQPLTDGSLRGAQIVCPRHGARFDLATGKPLCMPATMPIGVFEVRIDGDKILVGSRGAPGRIMGATVPRAAGSAAAAGSALASTTAAAAPPPLAQQLPPPAGGESPAAAAASEPPGAAADPPDERQLLDALRVVVDPELMINIVDLGLVYNVNQQDDQVYVDMTLTSPACPAGPQILGQSKMALESVPGVKAAHIKLVMTPPWTPDRMTDEARDQLGIF